MKLSFAVLQIVAPCGTQHEANAELCQGCTPLMQQAGHGQRGFGTLHFTGLWQHQEIDCAGGIAHCDIGACSPGSHRTSWHHLRLSASRIANLQLAHLSPTETAPAGLVRWHSI